jgi:hypothetical protein
MPALRARGGRNRPIQKAGFGRLKTESDCVSDYYVHVKRAGHSQTHWEWRILQRSKQIGIGLYGKGFVTADAARRSGEAALKKFLADPALIPNKHRANKQQEPSGPREPAESTWGEAAGQPLPFRSHQAAVQGQELTAPAVRREAEEDWGR